MPNIDSRCHFFIYVDKDGKMPILSRLRKIDAKFLDHHPYWIEYVKDKPFCYYGPKKVIAQNVGGDSVWDYSLGEFVSLTGIPDYETRYELT